MIKIDIAYKKEEIKKRHKQNFGENCETIKQSLNHLKCYTHFYDWFCDDKGNLRNDQIERLICADTRVERIKVIRELEQRICQDSSGSKKKDDIRTGIKGKFEKLHSNFSKRNWAFEFLKLIDVKFLSLLQSQLYFHGI